MIIGIWGLISQTEIQSSVKNLELKAVPPLYGHEYHDITLKHASWLAKDFLKLSSNNYEFGGFFNRDQIETAFDDIKSGHEPGIMVYILYDAASTPKLFCAFQGVKEYNEDDTQLNSKKKLYKGVNSFKFTGPDYGDLVQVMDSIQKHSHDFSTQTLPNPLIIDSASASNAGKNFIGLFPDKNKMFNFFIHRDQILRLISDTDCQGMNYYFGYDETENYNKIRLFFIAVNKSGQPITYEDDDADGKKEYQMILERAWP